MSADLIAIGDQFGCLSRSNAARPATCGLDIDVPLRTLKFKPNCPGGAVAARTSWPGAITSGFSRSPPPADSGPRDENDAVNGAGVAKLKTAALIVAGAPAVAA